MESLNPAQRAAVMAGEGPALVLAGAGSGKTRVIVERIVWLIEERGVDPRNILALTFTNRAAEEMRTRIAGRLGVDRLAAWVGTFHSFGLFLLRREMDALGRSKEFTVFDDTDQLSLMKRLVKGLGEERAQVSPREALNWISEHKQDVREPAAAGPKDAPEEQSYRVLWRRYHDALKQYSAVDFDDLLVLPAQLLEQHADVVEKYRRRYRYILVDEYQDTNRAQYLMARALAGEGGNLFVVGDEDQSIYSWRGADIRNILEFAEDFPGAEVFRLEQNYRSTAAILGAANAVVGNNVQRLGKTLWTAQKGGEKVAYYLADTGEDESNFVATMIKKNVLEPREVAVLFRTNGQARVVEEALLRKGIAYIVVGGVRFYGRKETKDLLSYLHLLVNPAADESLRRIINVPARGIGGKTLERLEELAAGLNKPLLATLAHLQEDETVNAPARRAAEELAALIDELSYEAGNSPVSEMTRKIIERTNYREYVQKSDEKDFRSRLEIVDEFVTACAEFDRSGRGTLADFLQDLALSSDTDELRPGAPAVTLMTCHSAKGLEFDHVFLIGLEEGLLPHGSALDAENEIEEERRLCYVAMTRARKTLTLSSAETRTLYGEFQRRIPSRFLGEIPREHLSIIQRVGAGPAVVQRPAAPRADGEKLTMGTRVRHASFGKGRVMFTSGSGDKLKVRIRFDSGRSMQFMVKQTPLEILEGKQP